MSDEILRRIAAIENRLARIELELGRREEPAESVAPRSQSRPGSTPSGPPAASLRPATRDHTSLITSILGWGGAVAFVLSASYLIRLGIDNGWLTPVRQVALASVVGFLLVAAGFPMRRFEPRYAGFLPAGGIVILFLAIYGGHLFYGFVSAQGAVLAVSLVCVLSLWLCRVFASDLYALFAVAGSYSAPFLLHDAHGSLVDIVIYFSAWSLVFSTYAIWHGRRLIYLVAMYMALVGFDIIWRANGGTEWVAALVFQTVQFVVFGIATAIFSVRRNVPLDTTTAMMHLPPLLLFYALQYNLLDQHLHGLAPWIAVASLAALALLYLGARTLLKRRLPGGELLLWSYVALVLFHAIYLESIPGDWAPWAAFVFLPTFAFAALSRKGPLGPFAIVGGAVGLIFLLNFISVVLDFRLEQVPGRHWLASAYALLLYGGYYLVHQREGLGEVKRLLVYAGHVSAMAAAVHLLEVRIAESTLWAVLAVACLGLSIWRNDRLLGQSSLFVFGATGLKVLLYDLSGAQAVARIVSLMILGVTFYAGGILYRKLVQARATESDSG